MPPLRLLALYPLYYEGFRPQRQSWIDFRAAKFDGERYYFLWKTEKRLTWGSGPTGWSADRRSVGPGPLTGPSECRKTVKTPSTGRKRVTRGTQEGFLSFSIGSFQNFFKGLKTCSGCRKHVFDSLRARSPDRALPPPVRHSQKRTVPRGERGERSRKIRCCPG